MIEQQPSDQRPDSAEGVASPEPDPWQPPRDTPAGPVSPARWVRSDDRVVLGVAGGIAEALNLDPTVVRLILVGLFLLDGAGVALYVLGALLMRGTRDAPPIGRIRWTVAAVVAAVFAAGLFDRHSFRGPVAWYVVVALVGIGLALWPPPRSSSRSFPRTGTREWPSAPTSTGQRTGDSAAGPEMSSAPPARGGGPRLVRSTRVPSPLGRLTLALAMLVGVLVWLINRHSANALRWAFSWAAVICGIGLLVGVVVGRARWLILPGALALVGTLLAGAVAGLNVSWADTGDRFVSASNAGELSSPVSVGAGSVHFDLSSFRGAGQVDVTVGAGDITIILASDAHIDLDATIGLGGIRTSGDTVSGYRRHLKTSFGSAPASAPATIHLLLHAGVGSITVETDVVPASLTPFPLTTIAGGTVAGGPSTDAPFETNFATLPAPAATVPSAPPTTGLGGGQ